MFILRGNKLKLKKEILITINIFGYIALNTKCREYYTKA